MKRKLTVFASVAALTMAILAPLLGGGSTAKAACEKATQFADVTGDGRADAIVVNNDKITIRRSDRARFLQHESWTDNPYYGSRGTYFADVTDDGKADAIVVNNDKITVRRSDGARFLQHESWTDDPYYGNVC
jgi:hypothetical protein